MLENIMGYYCYYLVKFIDTGKSEKFLANIANMLTEKLRYLRRGVVSDRLSTYKRSDALLPLVMTASSYKENTKWS
jgi:hypothetical protein